MRDHLLSDKAKFEYAYSPSQSNKALGEVPFRVALGRSNAELNHKDGFGNYCGRLLDEYGRLSVHYSTQAATLSRDCRTLYFSLTSHCEGRLSGVNHIYYPVDGDDRVLENSLAQLIRLAILDHKDYFERIVFLCERGQNRSKTLAQSLIARDKFASIMKGQMPYKSFRPATRNQKPQPLAKQGLGAKIMCVKVSDMAIISHTATLKLLRDDIAKWNASKKQGQFCDGWDTLDPYYSAYLSFFCLHMSVQDIKKHILDPNYSHNAALSFIQLNIGHPVLPNGCAMHPAYDNLQGGYFYRFYNPSDCRHIGNTADDGFMIISESSHSDHWKKGDKREQPVWPKSLT